MAVNNVRHCFLCINTENILDFVVPSLLSEIKVMTETQLIFYVFNKKIEYNLDILRQTA